MADTGRHSWKTQRNKVAYIRLQLIAKQTVRVLLYKTIVRIGSTPSLLLENLKAWHTTHNRECFNN